MSNDLGDFKYICPHCGQHFDCPPECEGVACLCPTCNNTIYPERPQKVKTNNSTLIISCDFLGSLEQASSNSTLLVNVPDTNILSDSDDGEEEYSEEEKELLEKAYNSALDQVNSVLNSLASALGGGSSDEGEDDVFDDDDEEEDDEIDWDVIDDDMQSDMEVALDSVVEDTVYDMPSEATEEFEQTAEEAWSQYRSSSSFRSEFRSWRDENGYDDDDADFAEDFMKDEWIEEWKIDNEDDWNETWCEEHADELKDRWREEKEAEWKKEWARDNAEYHNVTAEQILSHWGMSDNEGLLEINSDDSNNKNMDEKSINSGKANMKNKIPIETYFKKVSGNVTACMQNGKVRLFCDLSYPSRSLQLSASVYDEDGDVCGSKREYMFWYEGNGLIDIPEGSKPVRVVLREKEG